MTAREIAGWYRRENWLIDRLQLPSCCVATVTFVADQQPLRRIRFLRSLRAAFLPLIYSPHRPNSRWDRVSSSPETNEKRDSFDQNFRFWKNGKKKKKLKDFFRKSGKEGASIETLIRGRRHARSNFSPRDFLFPRFIITRALERSLINASLGGRGEALKRAVRAPHYGSSSSRS